MYYVIEEAYAGPNQQQHLNFDALEIHTEPARGNMGDHPVITQGWCGTTNDRAVTAHGEYATLEAARAAVERITEGDYREGDVEGHTQFNADGDNIVLERYLFGAREYWDAENTELWCDAACDEINAATTDARIEELVAEYMAAGRWEVNAELDADALRCMLAETRARQLEAEP